MSEPRTLRIDIWSDVMCPWCLVGWGSLQKGLEQLDGEIEADIRWHAFELNPDMPPEGEESTAHIARKYGSTPEQSKAVQGRMREAAQNWEAHYTQKFEEAGFKAGEAGGFRSPAAQSGVDGWSGRRGRQAGASRGVCLAHAPSTR